MQFRYPVQKTGVRQRQSAMALHYQFSEPNDLQLVDTPESFSTLLSDAALGFLADLHRHFEHRRQTLLRARHERQLRYDAGESPDFLPETRNIRTSHWRVSVIPDDLRMASDNVKRILGFVGQTDCGQIHFLQMGIQLALAEQA